MVEGRIKKSPTQLKAPWLGDLAFTPNFQTLLKKVFERRKCLEPGTSGRIRQSFKERAGVVQALLGFQHFSERLRRHQRQTRWMRVLSRLIPLCLSLSYLAKIGGCQDYKECTAILQPEANGDKTGWGGESPWYFGCFVWHLEQSGTQDCICESNGKAFVVESRLGSAQVKLASLIRTNHSRFRRVWKMETG